MTDKELKRLNRSELLEILLDQAQEIELLKSEIEGYKQKLEDRTILIEESGSLADASVKLTNVFEEAQKAADLYLENAKRIWEEKETKAADYEKEHHAAADTYEKEHKAKADEILAKAMEESRTMLFDAKKESDRLKEEAGEEAQKTLEAAKEEAAKTMADSKAKASELLENSKKRCEEMEGKAKEESEVYWNEVRQKIQNVIDDHTYLQGMFSRINEK